MFKHLLVGALTLSSFAFAAPPMHGAAPVAPGIMRPERNSDTRYGNRLLNEFDEAVARRDLRSVAMVDRQFSAFLQSELREARMERHGRVLLNRLNRIDFELSRLENRHGMRKVSEKRALYVELIQLADGRVGNRRF